MCHFLVIWWWVWESVPNCALTISYFNLHIRKKYVIITHVKKEDIMEKQGMVSDEIVREAESIIREQIPYAHVLKYSHNGANVFIGRRTEGDGRNYDSKAVICVIKAGKEPLVFRVSESVGNDSMTVFTRATVDGIPSKSSHGEAIGLYPYTISLSSDRKTPDTDILGHATEIYMGFDEENPNMVQIGEIFKKFVPMRYEEIEKQLREAEQDSKTAQLRNNKLAEVMLFDKTFRGF